MTIENQFKPYPKEAVEEHFRKMTTWVKEQSARQHQEYLEEARKNDGPGEFSY